MEKFKYGPLIWNHRNEDDESGNYYWNGDPPVDYDSAGIPIDKNGNQCLSIDSPVHPGWQPDESRFVFNGPLQQKIPDVASVKEWFDNNFLVISDYQCKKYILKWLRNTLAVRRTEAFRSFVISCSTQEQMIGILWPQDEHKS